jgi:hypothetical protein
VEHALGKPVCEKHKTTKKRISTTVQRMSFLYKIVWSILFVGYCYGFLAVFIISILSLGGLLAFPFIYKLAFQYVIATFTALAVGTLFGDAMFHLIPFVCFVFLFE